MFEFFKRKGPASPPRGTGEALPLAFPDGAAALEYACKFMECPLREQSMLPALVLDLQELRGEESAAMIQKDGNQVAKLRVASDDGGFVVLATTAGPRGPKLQPGQVVAWVAFNYSPEVAAAMGGDKRSGWIGLIVGTLKPEWRDGRWIGDDKFLP